MYTATEDINEGIQLVRTRVLEVLPNYHQNYKLRLKLQSMIKFIDNKNLRIIIGVSEIVLLFFCWKIVLLMMLTHFIIRWPMAWMMLAKERSVEKACKDLLALYGITLTVKDVDQVMTSPILKDELGI